MRVREQVHKDVVIVVRQRDHVFERRTSTVRLPHLPLARVALIGEWGPVDVCVWCDQSQSRRGRTDRANVTASEPPARRTNVPCLVSIDAALSLDDAGVPVSELCAGPFWKEAYDFAPPCTVRLYQIDEKSVLRGSPNPGTRSGGRGGRGGAGGVGFQGCSDGIVFHSGRRTRFDSYGWIVRTLLAIADRLRDLRVGHASDRSDHTPSKRINSEGW